MKTYKVECCSVKQSEDVMNSYAKNGWYVISVIPTTHLLATYLAFRQGL